MFISRIFLILGLLTFGSGCSHLFYHPSDVMFLQNPESVVREEVSFKSLDGTQLAGWFFKTKVSPKKGTVIQFHGNAQNLTSHFVSLFWMLGEGYDFFTFDYRGYGVSEGHPNQEGVNQDALAAIRWVMNRQAAFSNGEKDLVLYGQSLGGAVLMRAYDDVTPEERKRVKAMVIESSFYDYHAIGADVLSRSFITWLLQPLAYLIVSNRYGPEGAIPRISPTPLLVIHGDHDPVIPLKFGQKIFELAKEPKEFLLIPGGGHLGAMFLENGKYRPNLIHFLESGAVLRSDFNDERI